MIDLDALIYEKELSSYQEIYDEWCEMKTTIIHDIITRPLYSNQIFTVFINDKVYELRGVFTVRSSDHVRDIMACQFCMLDDIVNNFD